ACGPLRRLLLLAPRFLGGPREVGDPLRRDQLGEICVHGLLQSVSVGERLHRRRGAVQRLATLGVEPPPPFFWLGARAQVAHCLAPPCGCRVFRRCLGGRSASGNCASMGGGSGRLAAPFGAVYRYTVALAP